VPQTTPTTSTGPVLNLAGSDATWFVATVIGIFALAWLGLTWYDRVSTSNWRKNEYTDMLAAILSDARPKAGSALSADDANELAKAMGQPPKGIQGLTRTLIALGLLTLVGVALVSLLVGNSNNASELLKTVVTALTTTLITVVGFYFGSRATQADAGPAKGTISTKPATKPQVTIEPKDQTAAVGGSATFQASASGDPAPTVQWQVAAASGESFRDVPFGSAASLTVENVAAEQHGSQYRAEFSNSAGTATSNHATLSVRHEPEGVEGNAPGVTPPHITVQPEDQSVVAGQSATFEAAASGEPAPTVKWQASTDPGGAFIDVLGENHPRLVIANVTAAQNGDRYQAVFSNSIGTETSNPATLTVEEKPPSDEK